MDTKNTVLKAIKELGHTVSAADIAAKTGLSLFDSRMALNRIAHDTHAVLEVSQRGDICYRFFPDLDSLYKIVGIKKLLLEIWKHVYSVAFFILRVSFGVLLIASIVTILVVFLVALIFIVCGIGAAEAADGDLGDFGGNLDFDFFDWDELPTFFAWSTFAGASTPTADNQEQYLGMEIDTPDKGFFNNCFSFLFGEGNPNKNLEEEQWHLIAEKIRRHHGVVTADQIAPYLLRNKLESRSMLSVMVRFDGTPEVTQNGNIVYCFPSLQVTASGIKGMQEIPKQIVEREWKFSRVPTERLHWVFFFAGANLCGAYALYNHLGWFQPLTPYTDIIYLLMVYAAFFMGFPIVREIINGVLNGFIDIRNRVRTQKVAGLASSEAAFKIQEAQAFATQWLNLRTQPVFYSTSQDILPQDTDGLAQQIDQLASSVTVPQVLSVPQPQAQALPQPQPQQSQDGSAYH